MKTISKDILEIEHGIICHQVNSLGYMGAGLDLEIKKKWPIVYQKYSKNMPELGHGQLVRVVEGLYVANDLYKKKLIKSGNYVIIIDW